MKDGDFNVLREKFHASLHAPARAEEKARR